MSSKLLTDLPDELLWMIGSFLDWQSALRLTATSRGLHVAFCSEAHWLKHLHSPGFGVPNDHREVRNTKEHLLAICEHKKRCCHCRCIRCLPTGTPAFELAGVVGEYSMHNDHLPAGLSQSTGNRLRIHTTAGYPSRLGWDGYCMEHPRPESLWLSDHPLLGSRLISVEPLFHIPWVIERRYVSLGSSGQKIYPTRKQWAAKGLQMETAVGGVLDNPMGITVDDVLRALLARLREGALPAGSETLRCLELRELRQLVVVLGEISPS